MRSDRCSPRLLALRLTRNALSGIVISSRLRMESLAGHDSRFEVFNHKKPPTCYLQIGGRDFLIDSLEIFHPDTLY